MPHVVLLLVALWGLRAAAADVASGSLDPLPAREWDVEDAAHLLRRAAFGGSPELVREFAALGPDQAVERLVAYQTIRYEPPGPAFSALVLEPYERSELRTLSESERQKLVMERQNAERRGHQETRLWWLERMLTSPRPLEERMTLFWHGHFTSGAREVRRALFMKEQNDLLRRHALGDFRELLLGISRDRAMLVYLDNARNNKTRPNENYARELLELFTLGVGNYTEQDIRAAARAFTGWSFDEDGFRFRPRNHDEGPKTFLKRSGALNGEDVIDAILEQPACARFLARKLLEEFVRPDPEKRLVDALAAEIRRQDYELRPVLRTLLRSKAFYHAEARGSLVKSPVELLVGTARMLDHPVLNLAQAERALAQMGQELMQPPNVKGWDGGPKWINTATLFTRYNVLGALIHGVAPPRRQRDAVDDADPPMAETQPSQRSRILGQRQPAYDPLPVLGHHGLQTPEQVVDFYIAHLLAVPLEAEKRAALIAYLAEGEGLVDRGGRLRRDARGLPERIRATVHLLCSTPEYQMN